MLVHPDVLTMPMQTTKPYIGGSAPFPQISVIQFRCDGL